MIYCMQNKSTWRYENRVSKHFVIFRNFTCLITWRMFTVLFAYFVFFACFVARDLCRSGCRQNYYHTPPPPPDFFPTDNSFFNTGVAWGIESLRCDSTSGNLNKTSVREKSRGVYLAIGCVFPSYSMIFRLCQTWEDYVRVIGLKRGVMWCTRGQRTRGINRITTSWRPINGLFLHWRGFLKGCKNTLTKNVSIVHLSFVF